MPGLRLVIFDFDGTLCDSAAWFRSVYNGVARRFGLREVADGEFELLRGLPNRELVRRLGVPGWKLPFIAAHMRRLAARDADRLRLFPGVAETLAQLDEAGILIAIVTSNGEGNVRRILGPELSARIGHFGCGAALFGKRAKFRAALLRLRVSPDEALGIGDEARDIEAARAEGIAAGAVAWGYASADLLRTMRPDLFFRTMAEIAALAPDTECAGQKRQYR